MHCVEVKQRRQRHRHRRAQCERSQRTYMEWCGIRANAEQACHAKPFDCVTMTRGDILRLIDNRPSSGH
jgi:hypothetical protein